MSLKKSATRRLSLLAGSSLVAATLGAFTMAGVSLAPSLAFAANECAPVGVDPSANGAVADTRTCTGATTYQTTGITYSSAGNLTVSATGAMNVGAVGVNLAGNTTDSVTFTHNNILTGTSGPVIDVTSASGAISITMAGVAGSAAGVTNAVRAVSTGGGSITYAKTGTNASSSGINNDVAGGLAAVSAVTNGGNIVMSMASGTQVASGIIGRQRGFFAQTSGAGSVTMTVNGSVPPAGPGGGLSVSDVEGVAAIDATAGSGGLSITVGGFLNGGAGLAILGASTGAATITNTGTIGEEGLTTVPGRGGGVNLSGVSGGVTFNNTGSGRWFASGASVFSAANDTLAMSGSGQNMMASSASIDFGGGVDTFNMGGRLTVNGAATISNLEAFNTSGPIYFGGFATGATNGTAGDVLSMLGTTFVASGASRFVMDVNFAAGGQTSCATASAADCMDLTGGSTAGTTLLTVINSGGAAAAGSSSRTTLIVGSSNEGDFALDPNSEGYVTTAQGPALRRRLFDFYLLYDAAAKQHLLAAAPHAEAFQISTFAAPAQDVWRATTGSWFERQADLRATPGGVEPSRGAWVRAGASVGERDTLVPLDVGGAAFDQAISYDQRISHAVMGLDVLGAASQNSAWVIGLSAGYVRSDVEYDAPSMETTYVGFTGGLYASWLAGPLFVDVAANANILDLNAEIPSLGFADNVKLAQSITSLGVQAQAGWRFALTESLFAEPLVSVSSVQSDFEDIDTPGDAGTFTYDDGANSLRAGAGVRVGLDSELMGMAAAFSLTGRYWNELEGENATTLAGNAPTLLVDDFSGAFSEVVGSVNLFRGDGGVSGFVNFGGRFADDYRSIDGSVGVRMRW